MTALLGTESIEIVSLPPHMRTRRQVTPDEWVDAWESAPVRSESKVLAREYVGNGYRGTGWPTHPRVVSAISEDTGRSPKTVKRFHRRAKDLELLTEVGSHVFNEGMRATPVFALTVPVEATSAPAALEEEMAALIVIGAQVEGSTGWRNTSQTPPSWAVGR